MAPSVHSGEGRSRCLRRGSGRLLKARPRRRMRLAGADTYDFLGPEEGSSLLSRDSGRGQARGWWEATGEAAPPTPPPFPQQQLGVRQAKAAILYPLT
ncbi:Hypothetical predicted protein [Podarcis lilfordi]|uniref:Uncharacterized protein n=1 Tax=Podarcis lilfordi TaxID=74358 RepID=A0AA35K7I8_9SAUR|nr:Hypothetical predicted protein [Podarcis lilfordi]